MVDDEAGEPVDARVVAADVVGGRVGDLEDAAGGLVGVVANHEAQPAGDPGDIADVQGVHLGDGGDGDEHGDARGVGRGFGDLYFEGRHGVGVVALRTDFEAVEEKGVVDEAGLQSDFAEGQDNLDVLAGLAAAQRARVDLVVAGFEIPAIFGEEGEGDLGPEGVAPVRADEEGDRGEAVALQRLDGEEEVVGGPAFEIVDGCVSAKEYPRRLPVRWRTHRAGSSYSTGRRCPARG